jgi:hypothetical protein
MLFCKLFKYQFTINYHTNSVALAMKRPNAKLLAKFEEQIGKLFMPKKANQNSGTEEANSIGNLKTKFITDAYGIINSNSREGGMMGSSKKNGNVSKICVKVSF